MNKINYPETKKLVIESYNGFINEGFTPEQAIAAALEDSVLMMKKDNNIFIAVILNLAIISLKQHVIPDYLLIRLPNLEYYTNLNTIEIQKYEQDKKQLSLLLQQKYTITEDADYNQRINMLLG